MPEQRHWNTWLELNHGYPPEDMPPTLFRLIRLVDVGYVPQFAESAIHHADTLTLDHPRETFKERNLQITGDGWVIGDIHKVKFSEPEQLRISPEDDKGFEAFARTVPVPTWWDRHGHKIVGNTFLVIFGIVIYVPISFLIMFLEQLLFKG